MGLSDGRKSFPIGLAVLIQYQSVTASHQASQPPSHVAVAITLNAKASSLKMNIAHLRVTQHAVHAERDIVLTIPSVRPSHAGSVSRMDISSNFLTVF